MSCDCITSIPKKIKEDPPKIEKLKDATILHCGFKDRTFALDGGKMKTILLSNVSIEIEGRKSKIDIGISHTYCPFCGKKHDEGGES